MVIIYVFLSANPTQVGEQPELLPYLCAQPSTDSSVMPLIVLFPYLCHLLAQGCQEQPVFIMSVLLAPSRGPGILQARKNKTKTQRHDF